MIETITQETAVVVTQISIWTGTKKMKKEELGDTASKLPPDQLASLGTKRLVDPDHLTPIEATRKSIDRYMRSLGTRFLSGWLVKNDKLPDVLQVLEEKRVAFETCVETFLNLYDDNARRWREAFPEWERLLEIEPVEMLRKKFKFSWQIVKIAPTGDQNLDKGLVEAAEDLPKKVFNELSKKARDIWQESFKGRAEVTTQTVEGIRRLTGRMRELSYLNPELGPLLEGLEKAVALIPVFDGKRLKVTGTELQTIVGALLPLVDPKLAEQYSTVIVAAEKAAEQQTLPMPKPAEPVSDGDVPVQVIQQPTVEAIEWF